jgi:hypothetical protein
LKLSVYTFPGLGLSPETSDAVLGQICQKQETVPITANRNDDSPDSLESTIRAMNTAHSLPVLILADADRILHSREYAERVVEHLIDIDKLSRNRKVVPSVKSLAYGYKPRRIFSLAIFCTPKLNPAVLMLSFLSRASFST